MYKLTVLLALMILIGCKELGNSAKADLCFSDPFYQEITQVSINDISTARVFRFSADGKLFNPSDTRVGQIQNEVQAYRVQFSFDGSFIPGEHAYILSDINAEVVERHY